MISPADQYSSVFAFIGIFGFNFLAASAAAKVVNVATNLSALLYFGYKGYILYEVAIPSYLVTDMKPQTGKAGDRVTLTGKFYTNDIREVEATFAGVPAKVLEVTPLKIVVEAPHITNSGSYSGYSVPVELRLQGQSFQVGFNFQVLPVIKDFSPKSGAVGTTFFISAENLASYDSYFPDKLKVFMGGVEVRVLNSYYSSTGFYVVVPGNLTADRVTVSVLLDGVRTNLPGSFTVMPPTVTSISPASGLPESGFSIFGSNFVETSPYYSNNISVEMGDVPLHLAHVSADKLTAWVPEDLPAGDYKVVVKTGLHTVEAPQQYRVYHPSITSISPTSGYYNQRVIISGVFKPDQYFAVDFGSISTGAYSTANSLEVYVPAGTEAGKVKVSVKHGKRLLVAEEEFTVLAPTITSFSPTTGAAGSIITISGVGFAPNTSHMFVKFGTVEATILNVTQTDIRVMVPSGVTGSMKITLDQSGQIVSSRDSFVVTN